MRKLKPLEKKTSSPDSVLARLVAFSLENVMDTLYLTELNLVNFQLPLSVELHKLPETSDDLERLTYLS